MHIKKLDRKTIAEMKFHTAPNSYPRLPVGSTNMALMYSRELRQAGNDKERIEWAKLLLYYCLN